MLITSLEFCLDLFLGVSSIERKTSQKISVSFSILYKTVPKEIHFNENDEYICYQDIASTLHSELNEKELRLLEHLAYKIFLRIKEITKNKALVNVKIKKTCPYLLGNTPGNAQCEYKEF